MKPETKKVTAVVGGNEFVFETGKLGLQASGSVTINCGESGLWKKMPWKIGRAHV